MSLDAFQAFIDTWTGLSVWLLLVTASVAWVVYDLRTNNTHIASIMQWVWILTAVYSGPVGLYISLSLGLFAAWPANLLLIHFGLKGGMADPRDTEAASSAHCH